MPTLRPEAEWIETDGLGGFASGTVGGPRTRRYHALLLAATRPPAGRTTLVNGVEVTARTAGVTAALSSQRYAPGVTHPDGMSRLAGFHDDPWPTWTFRIEDGTVIEQEIFVHRGSPAVVLSWRRIAGDGAATLEVRPLLSGRDYHALHHENGVFRFEATRRDDGPWGSRLVWEPYDGVPPVTAWFNGDYRAASDWYRNFLYDEERARGLDHLEDLATPGLFRFDLTRGAAVLILAAPGYDPPAADAWASFLALRDAERRRRAAFPSRLHRSADDYLVRRGGGSTVIAGYPWFADWGRDTFIALRGLTLATGRLETARDILLEWSGAVSDGMLPNRFPDRGDEPEYNAVDASLWYVIAVHDYLRAAAARRVRVPAAERARLAAAITAILDGYSRGTRYGIRMDDDGLLAAGVPGVQLTWMDAKVGDWVVTPRVGKPVEVQALWINALRIGLEIAGRPSPPLDGLAAAFNRRFWNEAGGFLHDVVDVDHVPGTADPTFRPNQIFAAGGLPFPLLDGERARRVVEAVETRLWTPLGLRSLAPGEPGYTPRYEGGVLERDGAYHQGTVWPWLLGPFVEAWVRVRGGTDTARREARRRFLAPLLAHPDEAGIGHISEIADAEPPHAPRGCPFQAWSVGEALRLDRMVLAPARARAVARRPAATGPRRKPESPARGGASLRP